ncbi:MAG: SDR family oxidoreductase [Ignavibacteria bacterium]|nr:SDR family oxidoreductase [Ignavibacteria bacterium]
MSKYLITGGAGFIGSNIIEGLLKKDHQVRVLDNFSTGKRGNLKEFTHDIEIIEGDVRSYHIVQDAVKGMDIVLHQAALPSVPRSIKDPITTNEVNIGGTLNMLDAAVKEGIKRFVFASSSSIYGDNPELPKHEKMTPSPLSPYAVSKLAGENYCRVFSSLYDIETVCLRYFNVFGPRQDPNSQYSAVIPKFIKAIKNDEQPVIFGDGTQTRDFTYVENIVEANILASTIQMNTGNITANCACSEQITLNSLVQSINILVNKNITPVYSKRVKGDIIHSYANIDLIKSLLNWNPKIKFYKGLENLINVF